ncbi:Transcription elongation factor SPT4, partial [Caligus rogercresseyi]
RFKKGVYAISVSGRLPTPVIRTCKPSTLHINPVIRASDKYTPLHLFNSSF